MTDQTKSREFDEKSIANGRDIGDRYLPFVEGARTQFNKDTELIERLQKQVEIMKAALLFECGNWCAEQNPCNSKEALKEVEKLK